jgi:hypothetical protein
MSDLSSLSLEAPENCTISSTTLEANHILHVTGVNASNESITASLDLDTFIGNVNGALSLGHTGFSSVARNVALSADGQNLDAELPDANGDYSTSSMSIEHRLGYLDGQASLFMAYGFPHSTAHAEADDVASADARIHSQTQLISPDTAIGKVMTLRLPDSYDMTNPNAEWVKQNLGPYGAAAPYAAPGTMAVVCIAVYCVTGFCCVM